MSSNPKDTPIVQGDVEISAIDKLAERRKAKPQSPSLKMDFDDEERTLTLKFDDDDQALASALSMLALGTSDDRVFSGLLKQISNVGEQGKAASEDAANFVLGTIDCIEPQDEVEAMLATQMAVTHQMTMMMARRLTDVENIPQQDSAERAVNKLARTFVAQTEAPKKYRAKAQQTVRVERVTVNEGGQAIVGNVGNKGRAMMKSDANPMQRAHAARRCTARSKRTGLLCKNPAVRGWRVCRIHGVGGGHGPGKANPAYKHGIRSREWVELRKSISNLGPNRALDDT